MFKITIKNIFRITADKTVYVSKFNFEFLPRPGMEVKINGFKCIINGVATKQTPNNESLTSANAKYQFDLILNFNGLFTPELNKEYSLEIPKTNIFSS